MGVAALFISQFDKNLYPKIAFFHNGGGLSDTEKEEITKAIYSHAGDGLVDGGYNQWQAGRFYTDGPIILTRMTWTYSFVGSLEDICEKLNSYYQIQ